MARSPLTETINRVQGMITYVRENLSTDEYMLFLDLLVPEPEPEQKPIKKKSSKRAGKKSARASSLESAIKGHGNTTCVAELASTGKPCGMARPHVIHSDHNQDVDAHDFLSAGQLRRRQQPSIGGFADDVDMIRCVAQVDDNGGLMECGKLVDDNCHHKTSDPGYHPFQPAASSAPPPSDQASSEIGKESVGNVHHAAS